MDDSVSTEQQSIAIEYSNETCPKQDSRETVNLSLNWFKCGHGIQQNKQTDDMIDQEFKISWTRKEDA